MVDHPSYPRGQDHESYANDKFDQASKEAFEQLGSIACSWVG